MFKDGNGSCRFPASEIYRREMNKIWRDFWEKNKPLRGAGWFFRQGLILSYVLVFLVSFIGGRIIYRQLRESTSPNTVRSIRARENVVDVMKVFNTLYQNEAYARSYLQTFDKEYYDLYHAGVDSTFSYLKEMRQRQEGEGETLAEIDTINYLLRRKNENMERLFVAVKDMQRKSVMEVSRRIVDSVRIDVPEEPVKVRVGKVADTTVSVQTKTKPKLGFFKRLASAFKKETVDTVYYVHQQSHIVREDQFSQVKEYQDSLKKVIRQSPVVYEEVRQESSGRLNRQIEVMLRLDESLNRQMMGIFHDWQEAEMESSMEFLQNRTAEMRKLSKTMSWIGTISFLVIVFFLFILLREAFRSQNRSKALAESEAEKAQLLAKRDHLMKSIAHDIKSPLGTIIGSTDIMSRTDLPAESMKYLSYTKAASAYLLELVNNLLDYVKWQSGELKSENTLFCPLDLFNDTQFVYRLQAEGKGLSFKFLAQGLPIARQSMLPHEWFRGDALRIRQITGNLLSNAIKYTASGFVNLYAEWNDTVLKIRVQDSGNGISKEDQATIFSEFTRLGKDTSGVEGTGLGLSVTRKWVELLGGKLELESEEGKGSVFSVEIPLSKVDASEIEKVSTTNRTYQENLEKGRSLRHCRVAVIDDDIILQRVLCDYLNKMGMDVRTTTNPEELAAWVTEAWPHIVVTDLQMPHISGYEVLDRVKSIDPELPVILLTGKHFVELQEKDSIQLTHFSAFVRKPVEFSVLLQVIEQVLQPGEDKPATDEAEGGRFPDKGSNRENGTGSARNKDAAGGATMEEESFDLSDIRTFIGEDKEELKAFVQEFFDTVSEQVEDLKMFLEEGEKEHFRALAHKMASMFGQVKMQESYGILRAWERGSLPERAELEAFEKRMHSMREKILASLS